MNSMTLPDNMKDKVLEQELKRYNLLELLKKGLLAADVLLLNEIINIYPHLTDIQTDDGYYKIFNYDSYNERYSKYFKVDNFTSKSKARLEQKGIIKCKKGQFSCKQLGYCKIAIKLNDEEINKLLW